MIRREGERVGERVRESQKKRDRERDDKVSIYPYILSHMNVSGTKRGERVGEERN